MKRILAYILIFTALASIFTLSVNAMDVTDGANRETLRTDQWYMNIYDPSGIDIIDESIDYIFDDGYINNSLGSSVTAISYSGQQILRKAYTRTRWQPIGSGGKLSVYNDFTNRPSTSSGYEVEVFFDRLTIYAGRTSCTFDFNGTEGDIYAIFNLPIVNINTGIIGIYDRDFIMTLPSNRDLFDDQTIAFINDCYDEITSTFSNLAKPDFGHSYGSDLYNVANFSVHYSVDSPATGNMHYTVSQSYYPADEYYNFPATTVDAVEPVYVDTNIVSWLGDCVETIFSAEIFPGIDIGTLIWAVLGVGIAVMFIKFFAGG